MLGLDFQGGFRFRSGEAPPIQLEESSRYREAHPLIAIRKRIVARQTEGVRRLQIEEACPVIGEELWWSCQGGI